MDSVFDEKDFEKFESKVESVMQILQHISSSDADEQEQGMQEADKFLECDSHMDDVDSESFIVKVRENRTVLNKKADDKQDERKPKETDKFTFMQQVEQDATIRAENRQKREEIAQNLRKLGNEAYRSGELARAINLYTKAIDHVKDSPMLYNNRALTYIRLDLYKKAIIDCDFVINKLDEKNLRAWLYRAASYFKLDDQQNFEKSISNAKKNNSKEINYIDKFAAGLKDGTFFSKSMQELYSSCRAMASL